MGKTYKDRPDKYSDKFKYKKTKERPFKSSKGRSKNYRNIPEDSDDEIYVSDVPIHGSSKY